jgi:hypothetical protein
MAQTTIAQPQSFTPAFNPVKYIIDSTNKNKTGFKYIFDVYNGATRIGRFKVLPTYGTGNGEVDLTKFLSSYVSWDFDPTVTLDHDAVNSYYQYQIKTGEEYLAEFTYTSSLTNSAGFVRVNVTNTFVVGDQINIVQADGGTANPLVEGLHVVTNSSATWFEIGVAWSSVTDVAIDGVVTYADNRKVATYDVQTLTIGKVFNGARRWNEFVYWDNQEYNLNDPTKYWLTNQPLTNFKCTIAQDLWLNARARVGKNIVFENSNGELFSKSVVTNATIQQIAVGPNNHGTLTPAVGTLPLIKDDTTYYEFWYDDAGQESRKYRVDIDRRVQISEYDVVFLDRMGSMSSFAFQLKSYERGEVQRDEYNKDVQGYVTGGQWKYETQEFGFNTYQVRATKTLELNTNWMTQEMATYFEELITSPQCFLKVVQYVTTENGELLLDENGCIVHIAESTSYVPVILVTNSYEVFKQRNKNLIKQTVVVKLSNNDVING